MDVKGGKIKLLELEEVVVPEVVDFLPEMVVQQILKKEQAERQTLPKVVHQELYLQMVPVVEEEKVLVGAAPDRHLLLVASHRS